MKLLLLLLFVAIAASADWPMCTDERLAYVDSRAEPRWCDTYWEIQTLHMYDAWKLDCWCRGECRSLVQLCEEGVVDPHDCWSPNDLIYY